MQVKKQAIVLLLLAPTGIAGAGAQDAAAGTGNTVAERLERIENTLSNQGLLEMLQQVQALELEVNRLRGEVEVQNHALEQLKRRQRDLYTDIDRRVQRIETPATTPAGADGPPLQTLTPFAGVDEVAGGRQAEASLTLELVDQEPVAGAAGEIITPLAPPLPAQAAGRVSAPVPAATGTIADPAQQTDGSQIPEAAAAAMSPQVSEVAEQVGSEMPIETDPDRIEAEYRRAFDLLKQALYNPSIEAFRGFLARYPGSEYADNAQFWLAEAYYVNGYFERALNEYNALEQQYPESRKLSQAKLKAAFCQHELGLVEPAKQQLQELVQRYPGTTVASLAQDRLKQIALAAVPTE